MPRQITRTLPARAIAVAAAAAAFAAALPAAGAWAQPAPAGAQPARTVQVKAYFGRTGSASCTAVAPVFRRVAGASPLTGVMRELLAGPTSAERRAGAWSWFSSRTAGRLRSVRIDGGLARIDFKDFSRIIPNASTSCGAGQLFAELDRTAKQFPSVKRTVYSFDGSATAFYRWLQVVPPNDITESCGGLEVAFGLGTSGGAAFIRATNVSCATARAVARRCVARKRTAGWAYRTDTRGRYVITRGDRRITYVPIAGGGCIRTV